jgi:hypothetical protein
VAVNDVATAHTLPHPLEVDWTYDHLGAQARVHDGDGTRENTITARTSLIPQAHATGS